MGKRKDAEQLTLGLPNEGEAQRNTPESPAPRTNVVGFVTAATRSVRAEAIKRVEKSGIFSSSLPRKG